MNTKDFIIGFREYICNSLQGERGCDEFEVLSPGADNPYILEKERIVYSAGIWQFFSIKAKINEIPNIGFLFCYDNTHINIHIMSATIFNDYGMPRIDIENVVGNEKKEIDWDNIEFDLIERKDLSIVKKWQITSSENLKKSVVSILREWILEWSLEN